MARKILNRETAFAVIPGLLLAVYFFWNTPVAWDLGGHIQAARDFSKYIFPYFAGWNPHQLMGYPQGYFYPSLLYWLSSLPSSLGLPAETAFKALISLSLILLPVSWLSLLNSLKISSKVLAVILLWWVYFIPKGHIGGDFWGLFRIGLANQSFAVPFVFFYWAACCRDTPRVRELSFWLSLTILSHAFMALAAAVGGFLWIYQRGLWRTYWIHAGLCFGLCALWIVPYLLLSEYGTGVSIPISSRFFSDWATDSGWILGVAQIAAVALLILRSPSLYKSSQWKLPVRWMAFWFLALAVLMFADLQMQDGLHLPVHLYRLIILGLYVSMIPLSGALMKGFGSQNVPVGLALMLAVGSGAKALLDLPQLSESADLKKPFHVEDRILVNLPTKIWPGTFAPHFMTNHLANDGHSLANGLFVESSRNSGFLFSSLLSLTNNPFMWGAQSRSFHPEALEKQMKWLGVTHILSAEPILTDAFLQNSGLKEGRITAQLSGQKVPLWMVKIDNPRVEAPHRIEWMMSWDSVPVSDWWNHPRSDSLIANPSVSGVADKVTEQEATFGKLLRHDGETIVLDLPNDSKRWWILKESFFPHWKMSDGSAVLEAAPSLIAFEGQGLITLHFIRPVWEHISNFVSVIFWTLLGLGTLMSSLRRKGRLRSLRFWVVLACLGLPQLSHAQLEAGWVHQCELKNQKVHCWGDNSFGQVGNNSSRPTQHLTRVRLPHGQLESLTLGPVSSCALVDKNWFCWGRIPASLNRGLGRVQQFTPRQMLELNDSPISIGQKTWCQWKSHSVVCWGSQIEKFTTSTPIRDLGVSESALCFTDLADNLWCRDRRVSSNWQKILSSVTQVSVGEFHQCAANSSQLWCWGRNTFGQLGTGDRNPRSTPTLVSLPEGRIRQVSVGGSHTCALIDRKLYCWGQNLRGQSHPFATESDIESLLKPTFTKISDPIERVVTGLVGTCALSSTNRRCWGGLIDPMVMKWWEF